MQFLAGDISAVKEGRADQQQPEIARADRRLDFFVPILPDKDVAILPRLEIIVVGVA